MGLSSSLPDSTLQPGVCTSTTRPTNPFAGQCIYETDTGREMLYNGTAWQQRGGGFLAGEIKPYVGLVLPTGFLWCAGGAVSRTTFSDLFTAITLPKGTATLTLASSLVTLTAHGLGDGDRVFISTTGTLPAPLVAETSYFLVTTTTNTF